MMVGSGVTMLITSSQVQIESELVDQEYTPTTYVIGQYVLLN